MPVSIIFAMVVENDRLGVARDHRWLRLAEQKRRLEAAGCRAVVELSDKSDDLEALERFARPERTLVLCHAFLLADPRYRRAKGGLQARLVRALDKIAKCGAIVEDLDTGLTTADKQHRKALLAVSYNHIARSNRGLRSGLNGARSRGRPKMWSDPEVRQVIWDAWHSAEHKTNDDARAAAERHIGRRVYEATMFRVVKEMRREKGLPDAGGASGRLPGNPALRENTRRKKRRVYFIRCGKRLKIGVATNVGSCFSSMQTGSAHKMELLTCIPGDAGLEAKLHSRFQHLHIRREWFHYKADLIGYVQSLPKCKG